MAAPTRRVERGRPTARAATSPRPRIGRGRIVWHLAMAATLAFAVHAGTLGHGFVWDDHPLVENNPQIARLSDVPVLWRSHAFAGLSTFVKGQDVEYYRPVWTTSLALDHAIWGGRPFGYHLGNVLLHVACTLLVYALALRLTGAGLPALAAALLFAVHPAHVEAVAWISGRNELLAALFVLLGFAAYARWREGGGVAFLAASMATFVLGLLSKETALGLPVLALLWEFRSPRGEPIARRLRGPLLLALASVPWFVARVALLSGGHRPDDLTFGVRLLNAPRVVLEYLRLLILPFDLRVLHEVPIERSIASAGVIVPAIVLALVLWGILRLRRVAPSIFFGLAWALVTLGPVSGIPATIHPSPVAERYLYLPSVGLALAVGAWLARVAARRDSRRAEAASRKPAPWAAGVAATVIAGLAIRSVAQAVVWKDEVTFMSRMVRDAPGQATGYFNRGLAYLAARAYEPARVDFTNALRFTPSDPRAHLFLGAAQAGLGRTDLATRSYAEALRLRPNWPDALDAAGRAAWSEGRFADAERQFRAAIAANPNDLDAHLGLGAALQSLGRSDEAAGEYRAVIRIDPRNLAARQNLATLETSRGRHDEAVAVMKEALALDPRNADTHYGLGVAYEARGSLDDAEREFRTAVDLRPGHAPARNNLGVVLSRRRRYGDALRELREAVRLAPHDETFRKNLEDVARDSSATR